MSGYINKYLHAKPQFHLSGTPEEQISQLKREIENLHESVGKNLVREFEAISKSPSNGTTIINRGGISSGGGGGGSVIASLLLKAMDGSYSKSIASLGFDLDDGFSITDDGVTGARIDFDATANKLYRCGQASITTAGTTVVYSKSLSNARSFVIRCVNAGGDGVGVDLSSQTDIGFIATPSENATLLWGARPYWIPRKGICLATPSGGQIVFDVPFDDTNYGVQVTACISLTDGTAIGVDFPDDGKTETDIVAKSSENALLIYEAIPFQ